MEKMKVVGKQKINFTNKDGEEIKGIKLHCLSNSSNVEGQAVETIFINKRSNDSYAVANSVAINGNIEVSFNRWGKADMICASN